MYLKDSANGFALLITLGGNHHVSRRKKAAFACAEALQYVACVLGSGSHLTSGKFLGLHATKQKNSGSPSTALLHRWFFGALVHTVNRPRH